MKEIEVGNLVMFKPAGTYAKWFGGKFAKVESVSFGSDNRWHCRVRWIQPVKYHDKYTTISDFSTDRFLVCDEGG